MARAISLDPRSDARPSYIATSAPSGLPADLLDDASRRLQFVCLMVLIVSALNFTVNELTNTQVAGPTWRFGMLGANWTATLIVLWLARGGKLPSHRLLDVGLVYHVFIAATLSTMIVPLLWRPDSPAISFSPVGVWIIIYAIIVPNTTPKTAGAALGAAAAEPLVAWYYARNGTIEPFSLLVLFRHLWANMISVAIGLAISRMVYRLGRKLKHARSMGSYQLTDLIGRGGMGEVWMATHRMLARSAAVKLIRPEALTKDEAQGALMLRRFEREAQATAALRSPHTIELYDFGVARDGSFYYVMEMLDGIDLQTLVAEHGPQPPERVVHLLKQVCHSLHEAHLRGLVHRDIKPANIFVCRYGADLDFVKVLDFGLVKEWQQSDMPRPGDTQVGAITGTPAFIPPEMATGETGVDGRADIYALGCVAYWLLSGEVVFPKENAIAMLVAHAQETPRPPSERAGTDVPADLERQIMSCLEKNPADRPQSADALSRSLADLGLEAYWTAERAVSWWHENLPDSPTTTAGVAKPAVLSVGPRASGASEG